MLWFMDEVLHNALALSNVEKGIEMVILRPKSRTLSTFDSCIEWSKLHDGRDYGPLLTIVLTFGAMLVTLCLADHHHLLMLCFRVMITPEWVCF